MIEHYCNGSCTHEWLREMRRLECEADMDAVSQLPFPRVREYSIKEEFMCAPDDTFDDLMATGTTPI